MSNDRSNSPPSSSANTARHHSRRASVTGSTLTDLFARSGNVPPPPPLNTGVSNTNVAGSVFSNPAAAAQQKRRTSITTLGLSGSPTTQQSHFGPPSAASVMHRRGSVSSSVMSTSPNVEHAVVEEEEEGDADTPMTTPTSPFARRVSFGTRSNVNGRYPFKAASYRSPSFSQSYSHYSSSLNGSNTTSPSSPSSGASAASTASSTHNISQSIDESNIFSSRPLGEGFNWPEALRTRAERAPSLSFSSTSPTKPLHPQNQTQFPPPTDSSPARHHHRAASIATMEASPSRNQRQQQPPKEFFERQSPPVPAAQNQNRPKQRPKPDYFQEKILRADFMD